MVQIRTKNEDTVRTVPNPDVKLQAHETMRTVSRTHLGQQTGESEKINVKLFATTPAKVSVGLGRTVNLGNYESARVDVMITVPCYVEEIPEVYKETLIAVSGLVGAEVDNIIDIMKGGLDTM